MAMRVEVMPADSAQARVAAAGSMWAQFGDEIIVYGADGPAGVRAAVSPLHTRSTQDEPRNLHVVVQNGRLFQKHHPEVDVLHDRGRLLLVSLASEAAALIHRDCDPCYVIRPLEPQQVVFAKRARTPRAVNPAVQQWVDRVSSADYAASLEAIVAPPTRYSTSEHFRKIAEWAAAMLESLGYCVATEAFPVAHGESINIIARRPVTGAPGILIVCAHLDSINSEAVPLGLAPGADDNGSGAAGVLELARIFAGAPPGPLELRFILFGGEEQGLVGSNNYASGLPQQERARIRAVVNMDMISRLNQPRSCVLLEGAPISQGVIDALLEAASTYTDLEVESSLTPAASDHVSFINALIPAVLTIEGADGTNHDIHSEKDTLATVDYGLALSILRMNAGFIAGELRGAA